MIQTVIQGLLFAHHEELDTNPTEIKDVFGHLKIEYKNMEEYKEIWL